MKGLGNAEITVITKIGRGQCKALALAQPQPKQNHKGQVLGGRINVGDSLVELVERPEAEFFSFLGADGAGSPARVGRQVIEINSIVH